MRKQDPLFVDPEGKRRARIAEGLDGLRAPSREQVARDVLVTLHKIVHAKAEREDSPDPGSVCEEVREAEGFWMAWWWVRAFLLFEGGGVW